MLRHLMLCALLLAAPVEAGLFGSAEYARTSGGPLETWQAMASRQASDGCGPIDVAYRPFGDVAPANGKEDSRAACGSPALDTVAIIERLSHETAGAQLATVNAAVNRVPYVDDEANYRHTDYWATIDEFLARGGDCEDYATAKYTLLRRAGVPADAMRVVVVQDMTLGTSHAVLAVTVAGVAWILDNQAAEVKPAEAIMRYRPIYSINETGWWLHMPQS